MAFFATYCYTKTLLTEWEYKKYQQSQDLLYTTTAHSSGSTLLNPTYQNITIHESSTLVSSTTSTISPIIPSINFENRAMNEDGVSNYKPSYHVILAAGAMAGDNNV